MARESSPADSRFADKASGSPATPTETGTAGGIAGSVTNAVTLQPVPFAHIVIAGSDGFVAATTSADAQGNYSVGGLAAGTYVAVASGFPEYRTEYYDDIPCTPSSPCSPAVGTPIQVPKGGTASNIDFALDRLGQVQGTVTETATGNPASAGQILVFKSDGSPGSFHFTNEAGQFTVFLQSGTYFISARFFYYLDELYDDIPCEDGCDVVTGVPVEAVLNSVTAGIDFALVRFGKIQGSVTEAVTQAPAVGAAAYLWDSNGDWVKTAIANVDGEYWFDPLEPGTYFLTAVSATGHGGQLYQGLPCPGGGTSGCDPTMGTPVAVDFDVIATGIDFVLDGLTILLDGFESGDTSSWSITVP